METMDYISSAEEKLVVYATAHKIPIGGTLELTPVCNMNCDMCYVRLSKQEMEKQGRIRTGEEWLALGREMVNAGTLFLLLTGGEPLLHPDFKEIYLGLKKLGFILTINTNGTLIDEKWADFFSANKPRRINITLYGASEQTYLDLCHHPEGFEKTMRAIKYLRQRNVDVKINGSITPINRHDTTRIMQIADQLGVPCVIDPYMYPGSRERCLPFNQQARLTPEEAAEELVKIKTYGMNQQQVKKLIDSMDAEKIRGTVWKDRGFRCRAGSSSFMINWQGYMSPCVMVNVPSTPVFENGFEKSWKIIQSESEQIPVSPRCATCDQRNVCLVCAACAILETGDYAGTPEYMCRYAVETERLLRKSLEEEAHE